MPLSSIYQAPLDAPFWTPWKTVFPTQQEADSIENVSAWLNQIRPESMPVSFVPQEQLPVGMAYETYIYQTGNIPTRDGLHDFFNALCWFTFPQTKIRLNRLQAAQIEQLGITQARGTVRDAITVIDENGFLIQCPDELWQALQDKQWQTAFVTLRPLWQQSKVIVFGHALLEKLLNPYKAITAHAIRIPDAVKLSGQAVHTTHAGEAVNNKPDPNSPAIFSEATIQQADEYLAGFLTAQTLQRKPFIPIQIFGIPGWHEEQTSTGFYEDHKVFRTPNKEGEQAILDPSTPQTM